MLRSGTNPTFAGFVILGSEVKNVGHELGGGAKSLAARVAEQVSITPLRDSTTRFLILHCLFLSRVLGEGKREELSYTNPSTFHVFVELVVFRQSFEDVILCCVGLGQLSPTQ